MNRLPRLGSALTARRTALAGSAVPAALHFGQFGRLELVVRQDKNQPPHQQEENNGQGTHRYFSTRILLL